MHDPRPHDQPGSVTTSATREAVDPARGRRRFLKTAAALGLSLRGLPAHAEANGRVLVGFLVTPPLEALLGTVLREIHTRYGPDLGTGPVFLPGNAGLVAMDAVIRAPANGATALFSSSPSMTLQPLIHKEVMDRVDQLQPIGGICMFTFGFIVGPAVPLEVKTMHDYLLWTRANPLLTNYGVLGRGTATHFFGTEIQRVSGVSLKPITYKGLPPLIDDVAKGTIPAGFAVADGTVKGLRDRGVRMLAVCASQRWPDREDIPTLMELGLARSPSDTSIGLFISPLTPPDTLAELRAAVRLTMEVPSVRAAMSAASVMPIPADADYAMMIYRERMEWQARIARSGFSADS